MTPEFEPWNSHSELTQSRLSILADEIRRVRRECVELHDPEVGDTTWGLGSRAYERTVFALTRLTDKFDWITVNPEAQHLAFSFNIGSVPMRYFRGDPEDPPSKFCHHSDGEQYCFEFYGMPTAKGVYRVVAKVDSTLQVEGVSLIEIDDDTKEVIGLYAIPFNAAASNVVPMKAPPVTMPPAVAQPKRQKEDKQKGNAVAG